MRLRGVGMAAAVVVVVACGGMRAENPFDGEAGSGASGADESAGDAAGSSGPVDPEGSTGDDEGESGAGVKLDVGAPDGGPASGCDDPDGQCGCTAVDVLFVIDNSGSMCTFQDGLAAAFPTFVDAMYQALPAGTNLHVGITTSGFALGGSHGESNCVAQESQATIDEFFVRPSEGQVDGSGLQGRLLEHEGQRFYAVDTADTGSQAALTQWFAGAATSVGCGVSSFEFNAAGAAWALHPDNAATNAGFLRDEGAVLVIFILSDEADQSFDVEDATFLRDTVLDAKSACGGEACIVSGGLFSEWCTPGNNAAYDFLESLGSSPAWGDIWGGNLLSPDIDSYTQTVGDAFAQVVAQTCETIPPVG
jgi:hypothetical protein